MSPERRRESFKKAAWWVSPRRRCTVWGPTGLTRRRWPTFSRPRAGPRITPSFSTSPEPDWLERYCQDIPAAAWTLAERFWPGPMTMILPRRPLVPDVVTAGLDTVGMRCPAHPVCRAILAAADVPVAAPSGNTSGRPSPTTAAAYAGGHGREDRRHRGRRPLRRGGGVHHHRPDLYAPPAAAPRRGHPGAAAGRPGRGGGGPRRHPAHGGGGAAPGPRHEVPPLRPQGPGDRGGRGARQKRPEYIRRPRRPGGRGHLL